MKHYVIMRNDKNEIERISRYNKEDVSAESIKEKIGQWTSENKPELITDSKIIEVLNHIFKSYDDIDLQAKCENLEDAIEDIRKILYRF